MMTYDERNEHCRKFFWMQSAWTVVVKCRECNRHQETTCPNVMGLDGKSRLSHCDSCNKLSCQPVLKDKKTVAEVL